MSAEFDALKAEVTNLTTVKDSVLAYLAGLATQISDAAGDRAASVALAAEVRTTADAMAAAIVANTPAANPVPAANP